MKVSKLRPKGAPVKKIELSFVCEELNIDQETVLSWVECSLVQPIDKEAPAFDEEDLGRIRFLADMRKTYNTNRESLEVMMHLVDQIHCLTAELRKAKNLN